MKVNEIDTKALSELYFIISKMPVEYQEKIPTTLMHNIITNMDKNYTWNINEDILPETKALLTVVIREYFGNEKFNKKIQEYINFYEDKINKEKKKIYSTNIRFKNNKEDKSKNCVKNEIDVNSNNKKSLVIINQKWYTKIILFVRKIFHMNSK